MTNNSPQTNVYDIRKEVGEVKQGLANLTNYLLQPQIEERKTQEHYAKVMKKIRDDPEAALAKMDNKYIESLNFYFAGNENSKKIQNGIDGGEVRKAFAYAFEDPMWTNTVMKASNGNVEEGAKNYILRTKLRKLADGKDTKREDNIKYLANEINNSSNRDKFYEQIFSVLKDRKDNSEKDSDLEGRVKNAPQEEGKSSNEYDNAEPNEKAERANPEREAGNDNLEERMREGQPEATQETQGNNSKKARKLGEYINSITGVQNKKETISKEDIKNYKAQMKEFKDKTKKYLAESRAKGYSIRPEIEAVTESEERTQEVPANVENPRNEEANREEITPEERAEIHDSILNTLRENNATDQTMEIVSDVLSTIRDREIAEVGHDIENIINTAQDHIEQANEPATRAREIMRNLDDRVAERNVTPKEHKIKFFNTNPELKEKRRIASAEAEAERIVKETRIKTGKKRIQEEENVAEIKRRNNKLSQPGKNIKNSLIDILDYNLEDAGDNTNSIVANFLYNVEEAQPYNRVKYAGEQEIDLENYISLRPDAGEILGRTNTESLTEAKSRVYGLKPKRNHQPKDTRTKEEIMAERQNALEITLREVAAGRQTVISRGTFDKYNIEIVKTEYVKNLPEEGR